MTSPSHGLPARYQVERVVGEGGFGVVLRAHDRELDRPVAIKRLRDLDPESLARFQREARRTAGLRHPHVIEVLDFGEDAAAAPYLVYEWVDGEDLSHVQANPAQLAAWGSAIAEALHAAHQAGVIHRDVKPANVLLRQDGHVLLADLGIARVTGGETVHTAEGLILGTPAFMAPELLRGEPATAASDQWAWAASLVRIAGGAPVWGSEEVPVILDAARGHRRFSVELPQLPAALVTAVTRALSPAPQDRFPDLQSFADALRHGASDAPPRAPAAHQAATRVLAPAPPSSAPATPARAATRDDDAGSRSARPALALVAMGVAVLLGWYSLPRKRLPEPYPPPPTAAPAARATASEALARADAELRGGLEANLADREEFEAELVEVRRRTQAVGTRFPLTWKRWLRSAAAWLDTLPTSWPTWTRSGPDPAGYAEVHRRVTAPLSYWVSTFQLLHQRRRPSFDNLLGDGRAEYEARDRAADVDRTFCDAIATFRDALPRPGGATRAEMELHLVASFTSSRWPDDEAPAWVADRAGALRLAVEELNQATADEPLADLARACLVLLLRVEAHEVPDESSWLRLVSLLTQTLPRLRPGLDDPLDFASDLVRLHVRGPLVFARAPTPQESRALDAALAAMRREPPHRVAEVRRTLADLRVWVQSADSKSIHREHLDEQALVERLEATVAALAP